MAEFEGAEIGLRAKDEASPVVENASRRMEGAFSKLGASIGAMTAGLVSAGLALKAFHTGFEWVKKVEEAEQQVAGLILNFNTLTDAQGKVVTGAAAYTQAMQTAKAVLTDLRETALETNQSTDATRESWRTLFASVKGGSKDVAELVRTLSILSDIRGTNVNEMSDALARVLETGQYMSRGGGLTLAKMLKIPAEDLQKWNEAGRLTEELNKRLKQTPELLAALQKTASNVYDDVGDSIKRVLGEIMRAPVDAFKPAAEALTEMLQSEKIIGAARRIAEAIGIWASYMLKVSDVMGRMPNALDLAEKAVKGILSLSMVLTTVWSNILRAVVSVADTALTLSKYHPVFAIADLAMGGGGGGDEMQKKLKPIHEFLKELGGFDLKKSKKEVEELLAAWDKMYNPSPATSGMAFGWGGIIGGELPGGRKTPGNADPNAGKKIAEEIAKAREEYDKFRIATSAELQFAGLSGLEGELAKINAEFDTAVQAAGEWVSVLAGRGIITSQEEIDKIRGILEKIRDLKLGKAIRESMPEPETLEEKFTRLYKAALTFKDGFEAAWAGLIVQSKTAGQAVADAMIGSFEQIRTGFEDILFDGITTGFKNLSDILKSMFNSMLRSWLQVLGTMVQEAIFSFGQIRASAQGKQVLGGGGGGVGADGVYYGSGEAIDAGLTPGSSGGFTMAGAGMAGAALGGSLGQSGGTWGQIGGAALGLGIGVTAYASMLAGALVVPVVGWIAAAVGAIVIAANAIFTKSTMEWTQVMGDKIGPKGTPQGMELWNKYGSTLGALGDINRTAGGKSTDIIKFMRGGEIPDEFLRSTQVKMGAGSAEDRQAIWKAYLNKYFPSTLLSMAFGRTASGTNQSEGGNMIGVPNFVGGAGNTPLTETLKTLGFTKDAIDAIAQQIDTRTADEFLEWLKKLVGVVTGFNEVTKLLGRTLEQTFEDFAGMDARSPSEMLADSATTIKDIAETISTYAGDEQLTRAESLLKLGEQFQQELEKALREIFDLIKAIEEQTKKTIRDVRYSLMTPGQQEAEQRSRAGAGLTDLRSATSVNQVRAAVAAIQSAYDSLFDMLVRRIQAFRTILSSFETLHATMNDRTKIDPSSDFFGYLKESWDDIKAGLTALPSLDPEKQIAGGQKLYQQIQRRYDLEVQMLGRIKGLIASITQSFGEDVFQNDLSLMSQPQQQTKLGDKIRGLFAELQSATDPNDIERLTSQIRSYSSQYLGTFAQDDPMRGAAVAWVNDILTRTSAIATAKLTSMGNSIEADLSDLGALLTTAEETFAGLLDQAGTDLDTAIAAYTSAMDEATEKLRAWGADLTALGNELVPILEGVRDQFTQLGNALSGGGGPGVTPGPDIPTATTNFGSALGTATIAVNDFIAALGSMPGASNASAPPANVTVYADGGGGDPAGVAEYIRRNPTVIQSRF